MLKIQALREFKEHILPNLTHTDTYAVRTAWNDYTDGLHREGRINDNQRRNWTHPYRTKGY